MVRAHAHARHTTRARRSAIRSGEGRPATDKGDLKMRSMRAVVGFGAGLMAQVAVAQAPAAPAAPPAAKGAAAAPAKGANPNVTPELAKTLVEGVKVAAEDVVLVRTNAELLPLAELVVAEVARRGASPVLEFAPASVRRAIWQETPEGYLERPSTYASQQTQLVNAIIDLGPQDDPALEVGIDPQRLVKAQRAKQALAETYYGTQIRRITLGGASFPTADAAKFYKTDVNAFTKAFWEAVAAKQPIVDDRVAKVRKALEGLKVVKITAPGGTDLELRLAARPIYANTGRIDDDVLKRQGPKEVSLPAGEVSTVPTEFFANGTLKVDAVECNGVVVKDLKFNFREGKAELDSGGENFEVFKKAFNLGTGDKAVIASFSIGANEASKPPANSLYRSPEMAGVVTIGIGSNKALGGFNNSSFAARFKLVNATVKIDDAPIVDAGALKLK